MKKIFFNGAIAISFVCLSSSIYAGGRNSDSRSYCDSVSNIAPELEFDLVLELEPITPGFAILEGPIWIDGSLVMSHIGYQVDGVNPSDRIAFRDGEAKVIHESYLSNGLAFNEDGYLVAGRHFDGSITGVESGKIYASEYDGVRFNSPNDLMFSSDGDLYFSDPDWQAPADVELQSAERAYHVTSDGAISAFGEGVIDKPNGVMLSKNEKTLYVGGTNGLFKYSLNNNGTVTDEVVQILAEDIPSGVDGMSRDQCGNLFVAAAGKINIISSDDELIAAHDIEGITNIAFGGDSGKDIYITTLGETPSVYVAQDQWPVKGLPY